MNQGAIQSKLRDVLRDGQALALDVERGQATTPLADHFSSIHREQQTWPFTVAVLGLSAEAKSEVLAWLLGEEYGVVSVRASTATGMAEILLSDRGFVLEGDHGARREFDSLAPLLEALEGVRENEPVLDENLTKLSLAAPPELQGMRLLVPESLAAVATSPAQVTRLIACCHVLLFAAPAPWPGEGDGWGTLEALAQGIGVLAPVVTSAENVSATHGWWHRLLPGTLAMPPVLAADGYARPEWLSLAQSEQRHGIFLSGTVRRTQSAVTALQERFEHEARQLAARRAREERLNRPDTPPTGDPAIRRAFDLAKLRVQDDLTALAKSTQESSRRSLLPDGGLTRALDQELGTLEATDLRQVKGAKNIRLEVDDRFLEHLARSMRKALKEEMQRDLATLRDGLEGLRSEIERQLEQTLRVPVTMSTNPPSESETWGRMTELLTLDFRYKGELPKRGFLQRLGEGRRTVFGVMMILSLVGSMVGFNWRRMAFVGILFLVLFIVSVGLTFRSWKREDHERVSAEIDRVREQLNAEWNKLIAIVQREKQVRLAEALDVNRRLLITRIDDLAREQQSGEQQSQQEERERARTRLRKLEQQQRDIQAQNQRLSKLKQDTAGLESETVRSLQEGLRRAGVRGV